MGTRISGLSSGIDYEKWIADLMTAKRVPLDQMGQKKTVLQWKKEDYTTLYGSINDFRDMVFNYKLNDTLCPKNVASTNEAVLTATANGDAGNMSHSIVVNQLADGVKLTSTAGLGSNSDKSSLAKQFGLATDVDITINGKQIKFSKDQSIYELVSTINNAGAGVRASYESTLDRFFLSSTGTGSSSGISFNGSTTGAGGLDFITNKLKISNTALDSTGVKSTLTNKPADTTKLSELGVSGSFNLKINNTAIAIDTSDPTMTIAGLCTKINAVAGAGAATYNSATGEFTLKAANAGDTLDFSGSDPAAMSLLTNTLNLNLPSQGKDARITFDGVDLLESKNTFNISGMSFSLKTTGSANVVVTDDVDKAVKTVQSFIDSYNKLLATVNGKLAEKYNRKYPPLTDAQKKEMKDDDIKAWQAKARQGLMQNDPILRNMVTTLRNDIANPIKGLTGNYTTLSTLGITTGRQEEKGKLYLSNENKLRQALQDDPDILKKLFTTKGNDADHSGVAQRMYDDLKTAMDNIDNKAGVLVGSADTQSALAKEITDYNKQMTSLTTRLKDTEDMYYRKFSAMEKALSMLNSQSAWLSQQLGSK